MSKVTITPLRLQTGVYGTVRAHQPVEVDRKLAEQLLKNRNWVEGLTPEAKRRQAAIAQRVKDEDAAKAAAAAKAKEDAAKSKTGKGADQE